MSKVIILDKYIEMVVFVQEVIIVEFKIRYLEIVTMA